MFKCKICGKEYNSLSSLFNHFRQAHKDHDQTEYYNLYIKDNYNCKICGSNIEFSNAYKSKQVCSNKCKTELKKMNPVEKNIKCECCGTMFEKIQNLSKHLTEKHSEINHEEYYNKYIKKDNDPSGVCLECGKELKFVSIGLGYQKFCYNTDCNIKWNNRNNNRAKNASRKISKSLKETRKLNTRKEYWLDLGYTEAEAKIKIAERQNTNGLDKYIKRHGKVKGTKLWEARQVKWQKTMNSKSDEEIDRINRLKLLNSKVSISKAEKELCNILKGDSQFVLKTENKKRYVYDIKIGNKLIEYNGDYYHCNPAKWKHDSYNKRIKLTAEEKWKKDKQKLDFAKENGYKVLVIWESDWKSNKQKVIDRCVEFINE